MEPAPAGSTFAVSVYVVGNICFSVTAGVPQALNNNMLTIRIVSDNRFVLFSYERHARLFYSICEICQVTLKQK